MSIANNKDVLMMFLLGVGTVYGEYNSPEIASKREEINQKFIYKTTSYVIAERKKGKPLNESFEKFLKKDPQMKQIERVRHEGRDNASLSAVKFFQDVEQDLDEKGNELVNALLSAQRNKNISQVGVFCGLAILLHGVFDKNIPGLIVGAGGAAAGGYFWYDNAQKLNELPEHIKAVHTMEADWNRSFKIVKKDK